MARSTLFLILTAALLAAAPSQPGTAAQAALNVAVDNFKTGGVILGAYASGVPAKSIGRMWSRTSGARISTALVSTTKSRRTCSTSQEMTMPSSTP